MFQQKVETHVPLALHTVIHFNINDLLLQLELLDDPSSFHEDVEIKHLLMEGHSISTAMLAKLCLLNKTVSI